MKVERIGDLMFVTYFMVNWNEEKQTPSGERCTQCSQEMSKLEADIEEGKVAYEGLVCHNCKSLLWLRID